MSTLGGYTGWPMNLLSRSPKSGYFVFNFDTKSVKLGLKNWPKNPPIFPIPRLFSLDFLRSPPYSYHMLLVSDFILNHTSSEKECSVYPFALSKSDRRERVSRWREFRFPDICPKTELSKNASPLREFAVAAGEFCEIAKSV